MSLIKSKRRVADHGEEFAPAWMVNAMLDFEKRHYELLELKTWPLMTVSELAYLEGISA